MVFCGPTQCDSGRGRNISDIEEDAIENEKRETEELKARKEQMEAELLDKKTALKPGPVVSGFIQARNER